MALATSARKTQGLGIGFFQTPSVPFQPWTILGSKKRIFKKLNKQSSYIRAKKIITKEYL